MSPVCDNPKNHFCYCKFFVIFSDCVMRITDKVFGGIDILNRNQFIVFNRLYLVKYTLCKLELHFNVKSFVLILQEIIGNSFRCISDICFVTNLV